MMTKFAKPNWIVPIVFIGILGITNAISAQDLFKKGGGLADAFSKGNSNDRKSSQSNYSFEKMEKFVLNNKFKKTEKITERAYQFSFEYDDWTLPTIIEISKSNTNLWVTMILKYPDVDVMKYPDRLWKLLENNGTYGDCFFTVTSTSKAITLSGALQLNGPTSDDDVMEQLKYLASVSIKTEELWNTSKWSDAPVHVGSWAAEGGVKMSIKLGRNGEFELVNSGGTKTAGSYTVQNGKIQMTEKDGETISGTIDFPDSNHFTLDVNGNVIKFTRK